MRLGRKKKTGVEEILDIIIEYIKWMKSEKVVEDEKQELVVSRECVEKTKEIESDSE